MNAQVWALLSLLAISLCHSGGSCTKARHVRLQQLRHPSRDLLRFPEYVHGPGHYDYVLSEADRESGVTYLPAAERLRVVVDKLMRGQNISLATVGSSIMAGSKTFSGPSLPQYIYDWLNDTFPGQVTWSSGGVPGTTSAHLAACHNILLPPSADLVIVEYTISDWYDVEGVPFLNEPRSAFERMLRQLLTYPNRPAVILLHAYAYSVKVPFQGSFWSNAERDLGEFERFYHLPALSTKAAAFHHMHAQREGYYTRPRENWTAETTGQYFYFDSIHPDATTGCRVMAELVSHLLTKVATGLLERPLTPADRSEALRDIPAPMIPGNHESRVTRCFVAQAFKACVQPDHPGWFWVNESTMRRPKWGFTANETGSTIRLLVDSRPTSGSLSTSIATDEQASVQLMYLRSYALMGQAVVRCEAGCRCADSFLDGHHEQRNSLIFFHRFHVTSAERCTISVTVLSTSSSNTTANATGGHKVKLGGVIVSEVAGGAHPGLSNQAAMAYVGDISMISGDGTFDGKNHAR